MQDPLPFFLILVLLYPHVLEGREGGKDGAA